MEGKPDFGNRRERKKATRGYIRRNTVPSGV